MEEFEWNLVPIFEMWMGIAENVIEVRGQLVLCIPAYKLKIFSQFFDLSVRCQLICRSENLRSAITTVPVVSPVSCIDSIWLVSQSWVTTSLWNPIHSQPSWQSYRSDVNDIIFSWANSILHCLSIWPSELCRSSLAVSFASRQYCCTADGTLMACHSRDRVGDRLIRRSRILDIFQPQSQAVDLDADHLIRGKIR